MLRSLGQGLSLFVLQSLQHASNNRFTLPDMGRRVKRGPMLERQMSLKYSGTESEVKHSAVMI